LQSAAQCSLSGFIPPYHYPGRRSLQEDDGDAYDENEEELGRSLKRKILVRPRISFVECFYLWSSIASVKEFVHLALAPPPGQSGKRGFIGQNLRNKAALNLWKLQNSQECDDIGACASDCGCQNKGWCGFKCKQNCLNHFEYNVSNHLQIVRTCGAFFEYVYIYRFRLLMGSQNQQTNETNRAFIDILCRMVIFFIKKILDSLCI